MTITYAILFLVLGLLLGSFYGCMGYRIPNRISLIKPGSRCDSCMKPLKWYMNIPVISYLCQKGRCAYCGKPIDISNLMVEVFTGITFMCSYLYFGLSKELIIVLVLISACSVTAVSDFKYYYVSDRVIFGSSLIMLATFIYFDTFSVYKTNLIGMVSLFVMMLLVKIIGDKVFKRESLGGGDVKLMIPIGLALGTFNGLLSLFIASVLALIAYLLLNEKYNENLVPFGPFLLLATIIVYIIASAGLAF